MTAACSARRLAVKLGKASLWTEISPTGKFFGYKNGKIRDVCIKQDFV
jgi:hypothetical protein